MQARMVLRVKSPSHLNWQVVINDFIVSYFEAVFSILMEKDGHIHAEPGSVNQFTAVNWGNLILTQRGHGFHLFVKQAGEMNLF